MHLADQGFPSFLTCFFFFLVSRRHFKYLCPIYFGHGAVGRGDTSGLSISRRISQRVSSAPGEESSPHCHPSSFWGCSAVICRLLAVFRFPINPDVAATRAKKKKKKMQFKTIVIGRYWKKIEQPTLKKKHLMTKM